jgi:hypothetical protein
MRKIAKAKNTSRNVDRHSGRVSRGRAKAKKTTSSSKRYVIKIDARVREYFWDFNPRKIC